MVLMINSLIWNIRGIAGKTSLRRLKNLIKMHRPKIIAIIEPMVELDRIAFFTRTLGFANSMSNCANKIWVFWVEDLLTYSKITTSILPFLSIRHGCLSLSLSRLSMLRT